MKETENTSVGMNQALHVLFKVQTVSAGEVT